MNPKLTLGLFGFFLLSVVQAHADVNVSLNLRYTDPADPSEGGTWTLLAYDDEETSGGIAYLVTTVDFVADAVVMPGSGHNLYSGTLGFTTSGSTSVLTYGQDPLDAAGSGITFDVGKVGGPTDIGNDPLRVTSLTPSPFDHAAVIANGTFADTRPANISVVAHPWDTNVASTAQAFQAATTAVIRGDSVEFDGLPLGDTDRDFDVDTADITTVIGHYTGPGVLIAGREDDHWSNGDFDDDGDVDTADITAAIGWSNPQVIRIGRNQAFTASLLASVPEPSTGAMLLLVMAIHFHCSRSQKHVC